jgi:putative hydrolase of HD superfamily
MAWVLGGAAGLDTGRLLKLALVHDLPEAVVGDATPYSQLVAQGAEVAEAVAHWRELLDPNQRARQREEKEQMETIALGALIADLGTDAQAELASSWAEYRDRRTAEAHFVAQMDKLEALLQAIEYQEHGHPSDVASFLRAAQEEVAHPLLLELVAALEGLSRGVE